MKLKSRGPIKLGSRGPMKLGSRGPMKAGVNIFQNNTPPGGGGEFWIKKMKRMDSP